MAMSSLRDLVVLVALTSCGSPPQPEVPRVRFANAPPVTVVDDRQPLKIRPRTNTAMLDLGFYDRSVAQRIFRGLSLPLQYRARGVNSLDEVPDSTWFTNRIGVREMTPEEVARGPMDGDSPEAHKPWTIHSTKPGGTELGFIITDARGIKYGIGVDLADMPEVETGTAVVVNRLLWAFGYNVPDDRVAFVRTDELLVAPDAAIKDSQGRNLKRLRLDEVKRRLQKAWRTPDGRIRVLASRWLSGESLGGTRPTGTRHGDVNDRIPHQDRRDLRGQYPLFAWVQHVDLVQTNFLDMLIAPPSDPSRWYVVHYLLDFGKSMGGIALTDHNLRSSYEYLIDLTGEPIWTFGLAPRPWGHHWAPNLIGVSPTFVAEAFDPGTWRPNIPYAPFIAADRFDMFWGAKIMGRFTRAQIRAVVEAAQFSDPHTVDYLTDTLVARQRATLAYWYSQVNPLDRFAATPQGLCFEDLAISAQVASAADTQYELDSYDHDAKPLGRVLLHAMPGLAAGTRLCTNDMKLATAGDGYTIVKITTFRPNFAQSTDVHLARDSATGALRVIGVWRN